jgi:hypothetical protein
MHCCLITAPTVTEFRSPGELSSGAVQLAASLPQLGILNIAAVLEGCGDRPDIVDANNAYMKLQNWPSDPTRISTGSVPSAVPTL